MTFSGEQFVKVKVFVTFISFKVTLRSALNFRGDGTPVSFLKPMSMYPCETSCSGVRLTFHLTNNSQPT